MGGSVCAFLFQLKGIVGVSKYFVRVCEDANNACVGKGRREGGKERSEGEGEREGERGSR